MSLQPLFTDLGAVLEPLKRGAAILTPNRRLTRAVRDAEHQYRMDAGESVWASSRVMPMRQYWEERARVAVTRGELAPRVVLDSHAQRILWQRIIEGNAQGFSLLSASRAAALCQQASEILALWRIDIHDPLIRQQFSFDADGQAFLGWYEAVEEEMRGMAAITPEQLVASLVATSNTIADDVVLLHVDAPPPLFQHIHACVGTFAVSPPRVPVAKIAPVARFTDASAELQAVAQWCRANSQQNRPDRAVSAGRFAVVLSNMNEERDELEYLLRREFDCLTGNYDSLPVNFSTGFTMDRVPIVRDALAVLGLASQVVHVDTLVAMLQSRFLTPLMRSPQNAEAAVRQLRELCVEEVPQRVLRAILDPFMPDDAPGPWQRLVALESQGRWQQRPRVPSQWLSPFGAILEAWGWPSGRSLDSLEYQQLADWQGALDAFSGLDTVAGLLDFEAALRLLRQCLADTPFQPQTQDRAIQILGPLETTGLNFEGMWVTGMADTMWPAAARPNPYLPYALQRSQRMPHVDPQWELARAQERWADWCAGSREIQCSHVAQLDGCAVATSSLLSSVRDGDDEDTVDTPYVPDPRWISQAQSVPVDWVTLHAVPLSAAEPASNSVGSAVIEKQANCPFQAFAASRLRCTPAPAPTVGLLPTERGAMLHSALHDIFGQLGSRQALRDCDSESRRELIGAAVERARLSVPRRRGDLLGAPIISLEAERLAALLEVWLELEAAREQDFTVIARESERQITVAGLHFNLRLDRLDTLADGTQLVIDYKSGAPEAISKWFGERPSKPQLPIYALLEPHVDGISYASLKPGKLGFTGVAEYAAVEGISLASKWLERLPQGEQISAQGPAMPILRKFWAQEIEALAEEFRTGESAVAPTADACRYCQRFALCRVTDHPKIDSAEAADREHNGDLSEGGL